MRTDEHFDAILQSISGVNTRLDALNSKTYKHAVDIGRLKLAVFGILGAVSLAALGALFNFISTVAAASVK